MDIVMGLGRMLERNVGSLEIHAFFRETLHPYKFTWIKTDSSEHAIHLKSLCLFSFVWNNKRVEYQVLAVYPSCEVASSVDLII